MLQYKLFCLLIKKKKKIACSVNTLSFPMIFDSVNWHIQNNESSQNPYLVCFSSTRISSSLPYSHDKASKPICTYLNLHTLKIGMIIYVYMLSLCYVDLRVFEYGIC